MPITIRVELRRKPETCAEVCYPHEGACGAAEATWDKKPKAADVQGFLTRLLRTSYKSMEGDKLTYAPVIKEEKKNAKRR